MAKLVGMKEVLGENLYSKVSEITLGEKTAKITGMLLECEKDQILQLLVNKELLQAYVNTAIETINNSEAEMNNNSKMNVDTEEEKEVIDSDDVLSVSSSKESFAEELYDRILSLVNCEVTTAKITGMLLDSSELTNLMISEESLQQAVKKAWKVLEENENNDLHKKQLADKIYSKVESKYHQLAPYITGMLLELDTDNLTDLLENTAELDNKIEEALKVLS